MDAWRGQKAQSCGAEFLVATGALRVGSCQSADPAAAPGSTHPAAARLAPSRLPPGFENDQDDSRTIIRAWVECGTRQASPVLRLARTFRLSALCRGLRLAMPRSPRPSSSGGFPVSFQLGGFLLRFLLGSHSLVHRFSLRAWLDLHARLRTHVRAKYGIDARLIAGTCTQPVEKIGVETHRHDFLGSGKNDLRSPPELPVGRNDFRVFRDSGTDLRIRQRTEPLPVHSQFSGLRVLPRTPAARWAWISMRR